MAFPKITDTVRLQKLKPPTDKVRMVLDTDTYNEIDDQFAVVYSFGFLKGSMSYLKTLFLEVPQNIYRIAIISVKAMQYLTLLDEL